MSKIEIGAVKERKKRKRKRIKNRKKIKKRKRISKDIKKEIILIVVIVLIKSNLRDKLSVKLKRIKLKGLLHKLIKRY
jgi:hypothetical protein